MKQTNEKGRSMVEMLGVLAIIGVLSVAGIAGYTVAMRKHKANEIAEAISMLAVAAQTGQVTADHKTYEDFFDRSNPAGADVLKAVDTDGKITVEFQTTDISGSNVALCKEVARYFGNSDNVLRVATNGDQCENFGKLTIETN